MNLDDIYSKTEKGGAVELKTRQMNLPVQLRSVLIMVDGQHTVACRRWRVAQLGAGGGSPDVFEQLEKLGLIEGGASAVRATPKASRKTPVRSEDDDVQRFLALQNDDERSHQLYHLGLRGYGLMLRLQRASNLRDLHDLLPDLAQALVKRIGINAATPIVEEDRSGVARLAGRGIGGKARVPR